MSRNRRLGDDDIGARLALGLRAREAGLPLSEVSRLGVLAERARSAGAREDEVLGAVERVLDEAAPLPPRAVERAQLEVLALELRDLRGALGVRPGADAVATARALVADRARLAVARVALGTARRQARALADLGGEGAAALARRLDAACEAVASDPLERSRARVLASAPCVHAGPGEEIVPLLAEVHSVLVGWGADPEGALEALSNMCGGWSWGELADLLRGRG
jgi:hypothetical protein